MDLKEFYSRITITDSELEKSKYYINYRGLSEHEKVLEMLETKLKRKIKYSEIATMFRYDKRLRTTIYKYIGFIEEYIRSVISNNYPIDIPTKLKTKEYRLSRQREINTFEALSDMLFSALVSQFNNLGNTVIYQAFRNYNMEYMKYIIDLRNAVSHNRFMIGYDNYHNDSTLNENVVILYKVLPDFLKNKFKEEINSLDQKENTNSNQTDWCLPDEFRITL